MWENRPIVGIGDLVLDIYYLNGSIKGICGGGSVWNLLCNAAVLGSNCYALGVCGKDKAGEIAIDSLNRVGVSVENIIIKNKLNTKRIHENIHTDSTTTDPSLSCPDCSVTTWYTSANLPKSIPDFLYNIQAGILVFDSIKKEKLFYADQLRTLGWKIVVDIGHISNMRYMRKSTIENLISNRFDIVQLNGKVSEYIKKLLGLQSDSELMKIFSSEALIITYADRGIKVITQNNEFNYPSKYFNDLTVTDSTGAGDACFASFIHTYAKEKYYGKKIEDQYVYESFDIAKEIIPRVLNSFGARGHLYNLYNQNCLIQADYNVCQYCGVIKGVNKHITENSRNKKMRVVTNANYLLDRILRSDESGAYERIISFLDSMNMSNVLFVGTGGSYAAASYSSRVMNAISRSCTTQCVFPRDALYLDLSKYDWIILFSYSGTNNDIVNVIEHAQKYKNTNTILLTKGTEIDIRKKIKFRERDYIISYNNAKTINSRERGFLSFAGTICPSAIFARYVFEKNYNTPFKDWMIHRSEYYKDEFNNQDSLVFDKSKGLVIDIFTGDNTWSVAYDMESKFIESGLGRVTLHEKKDFSHGRFNILNYDSPDLIVYLSIENDSKYENRLLEYLKSHYINFIEMKVENIGMDLLSEFELLISSQYLIKWIATKINRDLSKPDYPQDAMKLYKYTGSIK